MPSSSSSRIPRIRTTTRARSALHADDDTDENLPPSSRPPSRAGKAATAGPPPPRSPRRRVVRVAFAPLHSATGQSNANPADKQMPAPPNSSQSSPPPRKATRSAATTDKGLVAKKPASKLPRARSAATAVAVVGEPSSSSNSLTVPTSSSGTSAASTTTTRRRVSRSPIVVIPPGPSHAPHVLAARRRASVSPLPATASLIPAESASSSSASSKSKRKSRSTAAGSTRPRPRPSELLPVPLGSPPPTAEGGGEDDADLDELLLLPPEMTRGRGEGKVRPPHHHHHAQHPGHHQGSGAAPSRARRSTSRQLGGEVTRFTSSQSSSTGAAAAAAMDEGEEDQSIKSEHSLELVTAPEQPQQVDMSFFSITAPSSDPATTAAVDQNHDGGAGEMMADSTRGDEHDGAGLLPDGGDDPYENDMGGFDGHDDFAFSFEPELEPELGPAAALPDAAFVPHPVEASLDAAETTQLDVQPTSVVVASAPSPREEEIVVDPEMDEMILRPIMAATTTMTMMEQPSLQFADLEEASSGSEMGDDQEVEVEVEAVEQEVPLADEAHGADEETAKPAQLLSVEEEEPEPAPEEGARAGVPNETAAEHVATRSEADEASLDSHDHDHDNNHDNNASQDEQEEEEAINESMSSSFEFPPHSARQSRPSYPPLSPNRTGEFDEEVPVRMASSSPEPEQKEIGVEALEEAAEPSRGKPVEAEVPDVFATTNATTRTTSPAVAASATTAPRLQQPELEDAKPVVASSTSYATFPLHGTPSVLPALLRPSTFFPSARSPSPAAFPSPRPLPSPASRPTLQFASPRLPRDRYPTASSAFGGTSPAPASLTFAPESSPAKSWTRGPAFFRSSSFSPPAHAALPKTATLFERHPGGAKARMMARGEGGAMMEQSREYQQWGAGLETSSPAPPEEEGELPQQQQRKGDEAGSERDSAEQSRASDDSEEEEDEVILVGQEAQALERAKSRSLSPASATSATAADTRPEAVPTPADAFAQGAAAAASSSEEGGYASPARSLSGDVRMASPSPRHSVLSDRSDPESVQKTPRDVGATATGDVDCRMASPSPARSEHVRSQGGSPLRARIGEFVEGSRSRIQGMLFGSPQSKRPSSQSGEASSASDLVKASAQQEAAAAEEAEQPFANSNHSTISFSSSHTSRRSSRRRSRPSHPTLPVIEISSTDAHAAARAAAILKLYHKYVEQGVEAVDLERLVAAEQAGAAFDASVAERSRRSSVFRDDDDEEEEEELRTLLHDAEEEVRELVPRQSSTPAEAILSGLNTIPPPRQSTSAAASSVTETLAPWTSREWRHLEQALVEVGRRRLRATSAVSAASTSMSMTSEAIASASVTGEDVEPDEVIETFLRKWSVPESNLRDEWSWDKLVSRVEALQARRAKDAQSKRASSVRSQRAEALPSQSSQVRPGSSRDDERESEEEEDGAVVDAESLVKLEASDEADEDALAHDDEGGDNDSSSDDDEGDAEADETFFAPSRGGQYRRRRRSSIEPVHQPTALANPALRHLYEATPAPEKPRLKGLVRPLPPAPESSSDEEEEDSGPLSGSGADERSQHTPEPQEAASEGGGKSPSSAQRLLSYLGSFVRRSPGASPSSSTRAAPRSSGSSSPEASSSSSSKEPEMKQVEQRSVALVSHMAKPLPPISDRKILPLPPSHVPVASTSKTVIAATDSSLDQSALAADTTTASSSFVPFAYRRRRRSSNSNTGERSLVWDVVNAIEEAESSREEEEARIVELLQNSSSSSSVGGGGVKRRAASGDLRVATSAAESRAQDKGKGKARGIVEVERELARAFVPTGTRALDRRVSGEKRATRR